MRGDTQAEPWPTRLRKTSCATSCAIATQPPSSEELTREFQRVGFRFDDGFVRIRFSVGVASFFGGIFFGGPLGGARHRRREAFGTFGRRTAHWDPRLGDRPTEETTGAQRPTGLLARIGRVLQGIGQVARLALGSGQRGPDLNPGFPHHTGGSSAGCQKTSPVLPRRRPRRGYRDRAGGRPAGDEAPAARQRTPRDVRRAGGPVFAYPGGGVNWEAVGSQQSAVGLGRRIADEFFERRYMCPLARGAGLELWAVFDSELKADC